jgi:hypothetical protein
MEAPWYVEMIISFEHNFIYWRPLKVGSSAVLQALGEYCGDTDIVNNPVPITDVLKLGLKLYGRNFTKYEWHMLPDDIREISKVDWDSFFKFTIVRNPWDMTVSMYWWDRRLGDTFSEWLAKCKVEGVNSGHDFFHEDYYFKDGKKIADYYLIYENLESEYKSVCHQIGIPYKKLPKIKHNTRTDKKHYSEYYNKADKEFVAKMFPQTIKEFGYEF